MKLSALLSKKESAKKSDSLAVDSKTSKESMPRVNDGSEESSNKKEEQLKSDSIPNGRSPKLGRLFKLGINSSDNKSKGSIEDKLQDTTDATLECRQMLLRNVKKQVKQIMEEAVTKKFIHEESSSVTSLCATVEACLQFGLKRRMLGLFREGNSAALLSKISRSCAPAQIVVKKLSEESLDESLDISDGFSSSLHGFTGLFQERSRSVSNSRRFAPNQRNANKYIWIKLALFEKSLAKIVDYLCANAGKYYEKESIIADPCDGPLLASLLAGPCALDFTRMKTSDHLWTDPSADELVLRHRIHSNGPSMQHSPFSVLSGGGGGGGSGVGGTAPSSGIMGSALYAGPGVASPASLASPKKLTIKARRLTSSSSEESHRSSGPSSAKEYVESLHQNTKSQLLYGKNNVLVQPREDVSAMQGYLSLHQSADDSLTIKWTPNQLMNSTESARPTAAANNEHNQDVISPHSDLNVSDDVSSHVPPLQDKREYLREKRRFERLFGQYGKRLYWEYALKISLKNIVYLHCHQTGDVSGGTIVLIAQDGTQHPPLHFPAGGHLLAFLTCLETGLQPTGKLDPPLWSETGDSITSNPVQHHSTPAGLQHAGKNYPNLKRRSYLGRLASPTSLKTNSPASHNSSTQGNHPSEDSSSERAQSLDVDPVATGKSSASKLSASCGSSVLRGANSVSDKEGQPHSLEGLEDSVAKDFVFRIVTTGWVEQSDFHKEHTASELSLDMSGHQRFFPSNNGARGYISSTDSLSQSRTCIQMVCDSMKRQILARAFYGWSEYCRHLRTVRTHLSALVHKEVVLSDRPTDASKGLTRQIWEDIKECPAQHLDPKEIYRLVYFGGVEKTIRHEVWPYLLGHYEWSMTSQERVNRDKEVEMNYEQAMAEWLPVEAVIKQRDLEMHHANKQMMAENSAAIPSNPDPEDSKAEDLSLELTQIWEFLKTKFKPKESKQFTVPVLKRQNSQEEDEENGTSVSKSQNNDDTGNSHVLVTGPSIDADKELQENDATSNHLRDIPENSHLRSTSQDSLVSHASHGDVFSAEIIDNVSLNLNRIDKDVARCDRSYEFFTKTSLLKSSTRKEEASSPSSSMPTGDSSGTGIENLDKLRNIMCTYVWQNLDVGYVQGMCDLLAPLLVTLKDEAISHACFSHLMERMTLNFPHGNAMDRNFENMRALVQILDPDMFEHMGKHGDYAHFYFCYRWFLLDFKRELVYEDVFTAWETIWSAKHIVSSDFVLFLALAMVEYYQEIIIENDMDFTDIIKFFNEMAERHNLTQILSIARNLVYQLQTLIDNST